MISNVHAISLKISSFSTIKAFWIPALVFYFGNRYFIVYYTIILMSVLLFIIIRWKASVVSFKVSTFPQFKHFGISYRWFHVKIFLERILQSHSSVVFLILLLSTYSACPHLLRSLLSWRKILIRELWLLSNYFDLPRDFLL